MHRKKILIVLGLFFCFHFGFAQENNEENEQRTERTKKVKLPKYFKASLPEKSIVVADIQILQVLPDSTRLGFLQKGMDNQKVAAVPAKDISIFLQEYITKQYSDKYKKEGANLLWVIKDLRINERTFFSTEKAFARLHADAYVSTDGNLYSFVTAVDTVRTYSSMVDVTSSHGENIAGALHKLLLQTLIKAETISVDPIQPMTREQISDREAGRFQLPIITDLVYKDGVYLNFQEFLQNNPSVTEYKVQFVDKRKSKISLVSNDSTKNDFRPWGICKGGELYKYYENDLIPIEKNGNGFIISDYLEKINRRNQGMFVAAFFGGLAGAAIANSGSAKIYSVTSIPNITKKQPEASAIDMKTGELTF